MIVKADLGVDLGPRASLGSEPGKFSPQEPSLEELGVLELNTLVGPLLFAVVLLSYVMAPLPCAIALLEAESSSGSLGVAKL